MEINEYLIKLFNTMKDMENLNMFASDAKFSKTEFRLVREIILEGERDGKIISSELARRLGITRSAVSQIVTKMEQKGILKRVDSPYDRKIAYVQLTDSAYAVFEVQCAQANMMMEKVAAAFGEERLKQLIADYDDLSKVFRKIIKEEFQDKK